jgi:hypothetical protein
MTVHLKSKAKRTHAFIIGSRLQKTVKKKNNIWAINWHEAIK